MTHCELFQTEEIQVIVGDASRNGIGGQQYCGIWSLTSKKRQFNAFGNSYAGLIPGEIRGKSPVLKYINASTVTLSRKADKCYPVDVVAEYQIKAPYYIDHKITFQDKEDMRVKGCDFRDTSWCCYMNCPEDPRLHFLSNKKWCKFISPKHGVQSSIAPSYIPHENLEIWPEIGLDEKRPFSWDWAKCTFDSPFYYGRLDNMMLLLIFDTPQWIRFFCSPSGGSKSIIKGKSCPAWDFKWVIPNNDYEINKEHSFRMRMVYKEFVSDDDVLMEYKKARDELHFELI